MSEFISGAGAGLISLFSIYPTEYLRIKKQVATNNTSYKFLISNTFKQYGIKGFYKGFGTQAVGNTIITSLQFGVYNRMKKELNKKIDNRLAVLLSGFMAGFITPFFHLPFLNLSVKLINDNKLNKLKNSSNVNKFNYFIKNPLNLWNGLNANINKQILGTLTMFATYDYLKAYLTKLIINEKNNKFQNKDIQENIIYIISGGIAGSFKCFINNPIDVVQTRLMSNYNKKYNSTLNAISTIYKEEGIGAFYKGCLVRSIRPMIGRSIMFWSYELINKRINK